MFNETNSQLGELESWTCNRRAELRLVADREAQLRGVPRHQALPWMKRVARELGRAMVSGGMWLQTQAGLPAQAER